eukprot:6188002-Pleurochrysis_carterae.AAC.3
MDGSPCCTHRLCSTCSSSVSSALIITSVPHRPPALHSVLVSHCRRSPRTHRPLSSVSCLLLLSSHLLAGLACPSRALHPSPPPPACASPAPPRVPTMNVHVTLAATYFTRSAFKLQISLALVNSPISLPVSLPTCTCEDILRFAKPPDHNIPVPHSPSWQPTSLETLVWVCTRRTLRRTYVQVTHVVYDNGVDSTRPRRQPRISGAAPSWMSAPGLNGAARTT